MMMILMIYHDYPPTTNPQQFHCLSSKLSVHHNHGDNCDNGHLSSSSTSAQMGQFSFMCSRVHGVWLWSTFLGLAQISLLSSREETSSDNLSAAASKSCKERKQKFRGKPLRRFQALSVSSQNKPQVALQQDLGTFGIWLPRFVKKYIRWSFRLILGWSSSASWSSPTTLSQALSLTWWVQYWVGLTIPAINILKF